VLPWGIYFKDEKPSRSLIKHELAHVRQMKDEGSLKFMVKYGYFYGCNLMKFKDHQLAYHQIPYEIEARKAEYKHA
jgi:hypothetical protein